MISIAEIKKPLSAYQYYTKSMRENWNNLSEESREIYTERATKDKERYEKEKDIILERKREETRAKKIFLGRSYGRVPCVGLDVGFSTSEAIGPAEQVVEYDKEEQEKSSLPPILPAPDVGVFVDPIVPPAPSVLRQILG